MRKFLCHENFCFRHGPGTNWLVYGLIKATEHEVALLWLSGGHYGEYFGAHHVGSSRGLITTVVMTLSSYYYLQIMGLIFGRQYYSIGGLFRSLCLLSVCCVVYCGQSVQDRPSVCRSRIWMWGRHFDWYPFWTPYWGGGNLTLEFRPNGGR